MLRDTHTYGKRLQQGRWRGTQHRRQIGSDERQVNKYEMMYVSGRGRGKKILGWDIVTILKNAREGGLRDKLAGNFEELGAFIRFLSLK